MGRDKQFEVTGAATLSTEILPVCPVVLRSALETLTDDVEIWDQIKALSVIETSISSVET